MKESQFKSDLLKYGFINYDVQVMNFPGTIIAQNVTANIINGNIVGVLPGNANVNVFGNVLGGNTVLTNVVTTSGNAYAGYFIGNGALLTGVTSVFPSVANIDIVGNVIAPGNVYVSGQVNVSGNVTATNFTGNGSRLTGMSPTIPATATMDIVGNVVSPGNILVSGQINIIGNVVAPFFIGNGSQLTGVIRSNISNANIDIVGNVTAPGNVIVNGQVNVLGNVSARNFVGNGRFLIGVLKSLPSNTNIDIVGNVVAPGNVNVSGQVNVIGNVNAQYFIGNGSQLTGVLRSLPTTANIDVNGNVSAPGNVLVSGQINALGNVVAPFFVGNGTLLQNVVLANIRSATTDIIGNVIAPGNVNVAGQVNALSNISAQFVIGNGFFVSGVTIPIPSTSTMDIVGNVIAPGNITVSGQVNVVGNIVARNFIGNGSQITSVFGIIPSIGAMDVSGNVNAPGNIVVSGQMNVGGNVGARNFIGNGSQITGIAVVLPRVGNINIVGNVVAPGNVIIGGQVNVIGNVSGAYFFGNGFLLSNTADMLAQVVNTDVVGNVTAPGNVNINGQVRTLGNMSAQCFIGNGSSMTGVLKTLPSILNMDIVGNVIGTYANVANVVATQGNVGNVAFVGSNIVAQYFIGNGSQLTGILNVIPSTVTANVIGNISGNLVSTQPLTISGPADSNIYGSLYVSGTMVANNFIGNGTNLTLPGYLLVPRGNVANSAVRLSLIGIPVGTVLTQTDTSVTYLLNSLPSSNDSNWSVFNAGSGVNSVFNRGNAVVAQVGDYTDAQIVLSANVGTITSGDSVANALSYLNAAKANIVNGNIVAKFFIGNVVSGNVVNSNVITTRLQINGNAVMNGQVNLVGNLTASYILGNGSQLSSLQSQFPLTGNLDIRGNVTAPGNVFVSGCILVINSNIRTTANCFINANVQANVLFTNVLTISSTCNVSLLVANGGVMSAVNFIGNANVTSLTTRLFVGNASVLGNVTATNVTSSSVRVYGNVSSRSIVAGDVILGGNLQLFSSNVFFSGNGVVVGNVIRSSGNTLNFRQLVSNGTSGLVAFEDRGAINAGMPTFGEDEASIAGSHLFTYKNQLFGYGIGGGSIGGYANSTFYPFPGIIPIYGNPVITKVKYSQFDVLILTQDGRVFTYGVTTGAVIPQQVAVPVPARDIFFPNLRNNGGGGNNKSPMGVTLANGQLYMFGVNTVGQLGRGTFTALELTPAIPTGLASANVIKLTMGAAGYTSVAAVLANGRIATWGYNGSGQLAVGSTLNLSTPSFISGYNNVTDAEMIGGYDGFDVQRDFTSLRILLANGASFAAGSNWNSELAANLPLGTYPTFQRESTNRSNIAAIGGIGSVNAASYIIQNDGQVFFAGNKRSFGVTVGATTYQPIFYNGDGISSYGFQRNMLANVGNPIITPSVKYHVSASESQLVGVQTLYNAMFLDNTGNLWITGNNVYGQLGIGNTNNFTSNFVYINQFVNPANIAIRDMSCVGFNIGGSSLSVITIDGRIQSAGTSFVTGDSGVEINPSGISSPYYRSVIGFESPVIV